MFVLDLFNSRHEKELQEGAVDNLTARLIEPLSLRAAEIRTQLRAGKLRPMQVQQLEKEYEDLVQKRIDIINGRQPAPQEECMGYGTLGEAGPRPEDVPAYLRKQQGQAPLTPGQVKAPRPDTLSDPRNLNKNIGNRNEIEEQGSKSTVAQDIFNQMVGAWQDELDYIALPFPDGRQATLTRPQMWNAIVTLSQVNPNKRAAYTEQKFKDFDTFMRWASQLKRYKVPPKKKKNAQPGLNLQPPAPTTQATQAVDQPQANSVPQSVSEAGGQKKNPEESDLTGNTARDPVVARELRKMRGRQPAAKSDIEALVRDEMDQSARTEQELAQQQDELTRQQQQLTQVHQANQEQGAEIQSQKQQITALNRRVQQAMTAPAPAKQKTATPTTAPATGSQTAYTPEPAVAPAEQPVDNKSAEDIERLEKQIQQLELMMTLRTPAQQDDLRDRIAALEKERDAKIQKQKDATAKAVATKKAKKDAATASADAERQDNANRQAAPAPDNEAPYRGKGSAPATAGATGLAGSPKPSIDQVTKDTLADIMRGTGSRYRRPASDDGEKVKVDPADLVVSNESTANQFGQAIQQANQTGKQLQQDPTVRRIKQQKDYELMLKKELANRIQDRDAEDDEQDFQDVTESNMKRLEDNLAKMSDEEFQTRYGKNKAYWRNRIQANMAPATNTDINDLESDIDTAQTRPSFDRTGRVVRQKSVSTQQGMQRMMGQPKATRPAPELEPVSVTMQVPNRKTDQYDLLPARIFNSEAEAREFARRVNGHITSIRPVMHEGFQDFKKLEPYAVCLAGRPVKQFDYYEQARQFHDNWKKKLYKSGKPGDKAKADKITLMPIMDEGIKSRLAGAAVAGALAAGGVGAQNPDAGALQQAAKKQFQTPVAQVTSPDDPSWHQLNKPYNVKVASQASTRSGEKNSVAMPDEYDFQVASVQGPNNKGEYLVTVVNNDDVVTNYVTKNPPKPSTFIKTNQPLTKEPQTNEAANPAQQAAIAIAMKKHHKKPKHISEDAIPAKMVIQGFVVEYDPGTRTVVISKRGQELEKYRYNGRASLLSFQRNVGHRIKALEDDLYGADDEAGAVNLSRVKVPGRGYGYQELGEDDSSTSSDEAESAILKRIMVAHLDLLKEFGPEKVMQAVEEVAYNIGDLDEIGSSDVSGWVHEVKQILGAE